MKTLIYLLLILSLTSCGNFFPTRKAKVERAKSKIQKLVKKFPELSETKRDTLMLPFVVSDTILIPSETYITTEKITKDTIRVETERMRLKLLIQKESVYIDSYIRADTVIKVDTVWIPQILETQIVNTEKDCDYCWEQAKNKAFFWIGLFLLFIFVVTVMFYLLKIIK